MVASTQLQDGLHINLLSISHKTVTSSVATVFQYSYPETEILREYIPQFSHDDVEMVLCIRSVVTNLDVFLKLLELMASPLGFLDLIYLWYM